MTKEDYYYHQQQQTSKLLQSNDDDDDGAAAVIDEENGRGCGGLDATASSGDGVHHEYGSLDQLTGSTASTTATATATATKIATTAAHHRPHHPHHHQDLHHHSHHSVEHHLLLQRQHQYQSSNHNNNNFDNASATSNISNSNHSSNNNEESEIYVCGRKVKLPSLRKVALKVSLWFNVMITVAKLVAYVQTWSLSVLAALLDAVLDVVSQIVLNYTERHSSIQRSSAKYPAGASRLEPIGVLTCAALMGMASFEVLKESFVSLAYAKSPFVMSVSSGDETEGGHDASTTIPGMASFWNMLSIVVAKLFLLWLCNVGANKRVVFEKETTKHGATISKAVVQLADPTLEALAQDHFNDILSNGVACVALLFALRSPALWFLDPVGAILISMYIIYSWYMTGKEQIEHLTGKVAPKDFIEELREIADGFDESIIEVDVVRAYHFGPKFLVEIEIVMPKTTLLFQSHDVGMELQYEIESREEVERCFVHIDYQTREYDEHVVSKVPELREKYRPKNLLSAQSV